MHYEQKLFVKLENFKNIFVRNGRTFYEQKLFVKLEDFKNIFVRNGLTVCEQKMFVRLGGGCEHLTFLLWFILKR